MTSMFSFQGDKVQYRKRMLLILQELAQEELETSRSDVLS